MSNGCGECNKWKQKHDHIFAEVRRQSERLAELAAKEKQGCVHNDLVYLEEVIARKNERISEMEEKEKAFDWMNSLRHNAEADNKWLRQLLDTAKAIEREHGLNERIAALESQVAKMPVWIPCSERLPEKGQHVIAFGHDYDIDQVGPAIWDGERWGDQDITDHYGNLLELCAISHWMPLPAPPQEQTP